MKIALVANPRSGGKSSQKRIQTAKQELRSSGITVDLFITRFHGHGVEIVRQLDPTAFDGIVSMGGDGTNYQVLNGLLKYHPHDRLPALGIIPVGRGNSFARDLPIRTDQEGVKALVRNSTRLVDVCTFTQSDETFYFVNMLGIGFATDVAHTAARIPLPGGLSYVAGVFHRLMNLQFHHMILEIDGAIVEGPNCFIEVCNSRYTGGAMQMAPQASIDDGWLDVVTLGPLSRWSLLKTFPKIYSGAHDENPAVTFMRGKRVRITTTPRKAMLPDGEIFGRTSTTIGILPSHVRYYC